ncbi:unnamed protein product, partial [Timema podura]|nr:unnamed protein product [Timema podura]
MGTPSTTSSGYGSQAVSITNLSSEDSMSIRSMSVDETPDFENKIQCTTEAMNVTDISSKENSLYRDKSLEMLSTSNNVPAIESPEIETSSDLLDNVRKVSPELSTPMTQNSADDESPGEGTSVVHTHLPPGK